MTKDPEIIPGNILSYDRGFVMPGYNSCPDRFVRIQFSARIEISWSARID
jgi:hypothetical protein